MPAALREVLDDYGNVARLDDDEKGMDTIHTPGGDPQPGGRAMGLWNPKASYRALDLAAHNGCEWRAIKDDPGALPGPGWMLSARGARGKPGERGKDGVHVTGIETIGYCVVLSLSNGQTLRANMLPMLELYERERKAGT